MRTHADYEPSVDVSITLNGDDMDTLLGGKEVEGRDGEVHVSICAKSVRSRVTGGSVAESPLDHLKRTWNEPRFGETPEAHFNRIHGVK